MITSKQRAYLRSLANEVQALYQIGKSGITESLLSQLDIALEARELIKIHVLENSSLDTKTTCNDVAVALRAEPVQAIGSKIVIYRVSKDNKKIELPKK